MNMKDSHEREVVQTGKEPMRVTNLECTRRKIGILRKRELEKKNSRQDLPYKHGT